MNAWVIVGYVGSVVTALGLMLTVFAACTRAPEHVGALGFGMVLGGIAVWVVAGYRLSKEVRRRS